MSFFLSLKKSAENAAEGELNGSTREVRLGIIMLHQQSDNAPMLINVNHIVAVKPDEDDGGSMVYTDSDTFYAIETPGRIYNMLEKAFK